MEMLFNLPKGQRAEVQYTDDLSQLQWKSLKLLEANINDSEISVLDKEGANEGFRFYRIKLP